VHVAPGGRVRCPLPVRALFPSSQGDDTFALYDREVSEGDEYEGGFRVGAASAALDGSEEATALLY
jgi:myo-inositol-hexaphosphate 3-phosphohydrolase